MQTTTLQYRRTVWYTICHLENNNDDDGGGGYCEIMPGMLNTKRERCALVLVEWANQVSFTCYLTKQIH